MLHYFVLYNKNTNLITNFVLLQRKVNKIKSLLNTCLYSGPGRRMICRIYSVWVALVASLVAWSRCREFGGSGVSGGRARCHDARS